MGSGWKSKTDHPRIAPLDAPCDRLSVVSAEVARSVMPDAIARIKSLVASYDEADRQASEYSGVIGVVDSGYRGEIRVVLHNTDRDSNFSVNVGDRIAQIIIEKHYNFEMEETESLADSDRGSSGFGSSGLHGKDRK